MRDYICKTVEACISYKWGSHPDPWEIQATLGKRLFLQSREKGMCLSVQRWQEVPEMCVLKYDQMIQGFEEFSAEYLSWRKNNLQSIFEKKNSSYLPSRL